MFIRVRRQWLNENRFGKLRLHGTIKVGKDCQAWQELECYLFSEMLICVKDKKSSAPASQWANGVKKRNVKCTLKGSILIKKHLKRVSDSSSPGRFLLFLFLLFRPRKSNRWSRRKYAHPHLESFCC